MAKLLFALLLKECISDLIFCVNEMGESLVWNVITLIVTFLDFLNKYGLPSNFHYFSFVHSFFLLENKYFTKNYGWEQMNHQLHCFIQYLEDILRWSSDILKWSNRLYMVDNPSEDAAL